ncbi:hypothetical protein VV93_v1c26120 [Vibrio vulnificus]|uniref:outer membrane beta-barrel protein n=1 Tax=Vibrio vulnificus TaxID=672 RepID=UPI0004F8ACB6|nr:outer membrane beta-barrel protein [Vibrio vulnificus]AIL71688.1 hypothetical protein VV93_v1c26120 [Vibrio vulnificus]PWY27043.1 porin family protein [Vibrio vulnificus]
MKISIGLMFSGLFLCSPCSYAKEGEFVKSSGDQVYLGADVVVANQVDVSFDGDSVDESADMGFNVLVGYEFNTHPLVKTSVEAEYRQFGDVNNTGEYTVDGDAFFLNLKTKLFVLYDFGNLYLAPMVGVGKVSMDVVGNGVSLSESHTGYQAGVEVGTCLSQGVDLHAGYTAAYTSIPQGGDDINIKLSGAYIGIRYAF